MNVYLQFSEITIILSAISLVLSVILIYYSIKSNAAQRYVKKSALAKVTFTEQQYGVSIVVYAYNETEMIIKNLPLILEQEYPNFEVIVVNGGCSRETEDVLSQFEKQYHNLYHTYTPEDACNLSARKLAITLGVKAAKHDVIVITNANCEAKSNQWLKLLMRNFTQGVEVVLGASVYDKQADRGIGKWYRSYAMAMYAARSMSNAVVGKPYRGYGNNMAMTKELFFRVKGFSRTLNFHYGEDDLFINEITNESNTRVELSPESILTIDSKNVKRDYEERRIRSVFTSHYMHTSANMQPAYEHVSLWLFYATVICLAVSDYKNIIVGAVALVLLLGVGLTQIILYRKTATMLSVKRLFFMVPLFKLIEPFSNVYYRMIGRNSRNKNYTWQRKR